MKRMEQFLIVVLLAGGTRAFFPVDETTCDLNANRCPCSPHLKGTVYIQCDVMANASGREMKCLKVLPKVNITVFSLKKENITIDKEFNNRLQFLIKNGTLKITNLRRNDSGQYSIEVFNSNGVQEKNILFTLDVKDNGKVEGLETCCDIKQHGAQCYGSLGGNVDIQLMDNTSKTSKYQLMKNLLKILNVRNNKVLPNAEGQRFVFFPSNGTFRIPNMSRNDSGNYTLQTFDSDGRASGDWTLQLFIQAPVSSVLLLSECLSQGEMRVSCFAEGGDSPQYSWTLDGRTLTDVELLPGNNETNIITLKQHISGHLVCSVRNNVSNVSKEERISTCEAGILQVIGGVLLALVILLVVGIGIIFNQRKKQNYKPTKEKDGEDDRVELRAAVKLEAEVELEFEVEIESEDEDEGEGEGEAQAEKKVEVEYAQVKFPKQPRHTQPTGNNYLYATVRKMR
ncbi:uncharacterized protein LOC102077425 isoform X2 [Oreochromis niloticus]|uniref:uncharacterized protein LOC102077425 isoform X2 n=1 Tax=Oreochromis niloticus TaxID=8128 RepID=UPI0006745233|nr:uncharacterized protein LOC102077425 isoform X2 [Oreochromis niloticus]